RVERPRVRLEKRADRSSWPPVLASESSMLRRPSILVDALGGVAFLVIVIGVAGAVVGAAAMNAAADDLRGQVKAASGQPLDQPRTMYGAWLANQLSPAVVPADLSPSVIYADTLDHR